MREAKKLADMTHEELKAHLESVKEMYVNGKEALKEISSRLQEIQYELDRRKSANEPYHTHLCQTCGLVWRCTDTSGDSSDTDCRWYESVLCPTCVIERLEK